MNTAMINNIIIDGMSFALPLFIMAIGGIYSERGGVTNLALEGLQGMGAFIGALAAILLMPYLPKMRENVAQMLNLTADRVSIKATTEERMGFTGSGEGIAAQAVCCLTQLKDLITDDMVFGAPPAGCDGCWRRQEGWRWGSTSISHHRAKGCAVDSR